jgi:hypothetical protein
MRQGRAPHRTQEKEQVVSSDAPNTFRLITTAAITHGVPMALSSGNHAASAVESIGESGSIKSLQQRKPLLRVIAVLPNAVNDRLIAPDSRLTMTTSGSTMAHENGLITGEDGRTRCFWPGNLPDYLAYHDHEWGRP